MAINSIPGVGPQNSDIATAVAAAVPTISAINTSVSTYAPSASTIAAAVAAPSSSTIATAVAAAVPTLSQINTSVATYSPAAGFGNTYTLLASGSISGSTFTLSWSGTYKKIVVTYPCFNNSATANGYIRLNGDSSTSAYNFGPSVYTRSNGYALGYTSYNQSGFQFSNGLFGSYANSAYLVIENASSTSAKIVNGGIMSDSGSGSAVVNQIIGASYHGGSAITSVSLVAASGTLSNLVGVATVYGVN